MKNVDDDRSQYLKRNQHLFHATLNEFSSHAYAHASLNEIIRASSFNKGSFYYRYGDKKDLYFALLDCMYADQLVCQDIHGLRFDDTQSLEESIRILFEILWQSFLEEPRYLRILRRVHGENQQLKNEILTHCIPSMFDLWVAHFKQMVTPLSAMQEVDEDYVIHTVRLLYFCISDHCGFSFERSAFDRYLELSVRCVGNTLPPDIHPTQEANSSDAQKMAHLTRKGRITTMICNHALDQSHQDMIIGARFPDHSTNDFDQPFFWLDGKSCFHECGIINTFISLNQLSNQKAWQLTKNSLMRLMRNAHLESFMSQRIHRIPPHLRYWIYGIIALANHPSFVVIDFTKHPMNHAEIKRFSAFMLKNRHKNCTILFVFNHMDSIPKDSQNIAFMVDGHIHSVVPYASIIDRYGSGFIIIRYRDREGHIKTTRINRCDFHSIMAENEWLDDQILDISTWNKLDNQIFYLETGVSLDV